MSRYEAKRSISLLKGRFFVTVLATPSVRVSRLISSTNNLTCLRCLVQLNIDIAELSPRILVVDSGVVPSGEHRLNVTSSVSFYFTLSLLPILNFQSIVWSGNNRFASITQQDSPTATLGTPTPSTPTPSTPTRTGRASKSRLLPHCFYIISNTAF